MKIFTVRIFKNFGGVGTRGEWSNSYHVITDKAIDDVVLTNLVRRLAANEASFHLSGVTFSRAIISEYHRGRQPNPKPEPHLVPLGFVGGLVDQPAADGTSRQLPAEVVLVVTHAGSNGRGGRNLYRYAIGTGDWSGTGGGVKLTQAKLDFVTNALNNIHDGDGNPLNFVIPSHTADGQPGKAVTQVLCSGAANRQVRQHRRKKRSDKAPTTAADANDLLKQITGDFGLVNPILGELIKDPVNSTSVAKNVLQAAVAGLSLIKQLGPVAPEAAVAIENALPALAAAAL